MQYNLQFILLLYFQKQTITNINKQRRSMILDSTDPSGLGLFSRCARNQACKSTKNRPQSANNKKQQQFKINQSKRKNTISNSAFDRQQSRDQRQRKYKKQITPAVGQYNPLLKQKPKLIWDFLKVYQKKSKLQKKVLQHKHTQDNQFIQNKQNPSLSNLVRQVDQNLKRSSKQIIELDQSKLLARQSPSRRQKTSVSHKSQAIVDMSRMTGRESRKLTLSVQNVDTQAIDLSRSISYLKGKTVKNIYFKKMLPRTNKDIKISTANIYNCNYDLIKSKKRGSNGPVKFQFLKGRNQQKAKDNNFSYSHYDYNEYVWKSNSSIFKNTKTHQICFDKMSTRYM